MGVVTAGFLWRHIKYALLIIFIVAAIVTPDGGGVSLSRDVAVADVVLYVFSIGVAWIFAEEAQDDADDSVATRGRSRPVSRPSRTRRSRSPARRTSRTCRGRRLRAERDVADRGLRLGLDRRPRTRRSRTTARSTKPGRPSMICLNSS